MVGGGTRRREKRENCSQDVIYDKRKIIKIEWNFSENV